MTRQEFEEKKNVFIWQMKISQFDVPQTQNFDNENVRGWQITNLV